MNDSQLGVAYQKLTEWARLINWVTGWVAVACWLLWKRGNIFLINPFPSPFPSVNWHSTGPVFWMHWQNVCYVTNCFLLYFGVIFLLFISDRFFFISLEVKLYINIDYQKVSIFLILLWFKFFFFICVWKEKNFEVLIIRPI